MKELKSKKKLARKMAREFLWLQRKRNRVFDIWQPLLRKQTDEKQKKN